MKFMQVAPTQMEEELQDQPSEQQLAASSRKLFDHPLQEKDDSVAQQASPWL